jgi:oligosaccharide repeat unit polymerase
MNPAPPASSGRPARAGILSLTHALLLVAATTIYASPALLGYGEVYAGRVRLAVPLELETRLVCLLAVVTSLVALILYPRFQLRAPRSTSASDAATICGAVIVLGIYTLLTRELYSASKAEVLDAINPLHYGFIYASILGFICSIYTSGLRRKMLVGVCGCGLLLALYIGFRSYLMIAAVAVAYVTFRGASILRIKPWMLVTVAAVGAILVAYKSVYQAIKLGLYYRVTDILSLSNLGTVISQGFEPLSTIMILDSVVSSNYRVECSNVFWSLFTLVPFSNKVLDYESCSFSGGVQNTLFSDADYGVGSSIWAEAIASYGYAGIPLFVILIMLLCASVERIVGLVRSPILHAGAAIFVVQMAFYIQRNDFLQAFTFGRRAAFVAIVLAISSLVLSTLLKAAPDRRYRLKGDGT